MTAWPGDLPQPSYKGFSIVPLPRARQFDPDEGPSTSRMFSTAGRFRVTLLYEECTAADVSAFLSFWAGDGKAGAAWFTFPQPFSGGTVNAKFVVGSEPHVTENAPDFDVTITFEVDAW